MIFCHCRVLSDRDAKKYLQGNNGCTKFSDVYKACSGGESPKCGTCKPTLRAIMQEHSMQSHKKIPA